MRIAYFDCFSGISGDMTLGAFLDAGLSFSVLKKGLSKLKLKRRYGLKARKVMRGAIAGTKFDCVISGNERHCHRSLKEVLALINKSSLNDRVKDAARGIFYNIGEAESKVHGARSGRDERLHELGGIDSIVDVVGTAIAIDELRIDEVYASKINLGGGFIAARHGRLPVPAPAALELLRGAPVVISGIESELVTPTGAAILKTLSKSFGRLPQMKASAIGYGAGSRQLESMPNMLRVIIGEAVHSFAEDKVFVIETNIDDMNPQHFEYLFERLFAEGALDVYTTAIQMKKSRTAIKLSVLAEPSDLESISSVIFSETTTIGTRFYEADRYKLSRKTSRVKTPYGNIGVKISGAGSMATVSPEHDECVSIAREKKIPLKTVYEEAKRAAKFFGPPL
ncbi:MAG: nickel pincer cofactor biosynthesis protein LarC [Candidatus Omnitrophota bacterium]|nr:nickel pincer cofactor biosynthesis protein LarC [Candidatus Omnitrophota bacterium]